MNLQDECRVCSAEDCHMWSNQTLKGKAVSIAYTADYVLFTCVTALIVGVLVTCLAIMSFGKSG